MKRKHQSNYYKKFNKLDPISFDFRFGAGSEFGREAKEEARRKKLGIISRKYKPEDQPWILKTFGSSVKKFKGKNANDK